MKGPVRSRCLWTVILPIPVPPQAEPNFNHGESHIIMRYSNNHREQQQRRDGTRCACLVSRRIVISDPMPNAAKRKLLHQNGSVSLEDDRRMGLCGRALFLLRTGKGGILAWINLQCQKISGVALALPLICTVRLVLHRRSARDSIEVSSNNRLADTGTVTTGVGPHPRESLA